MSLFEDGGALLGEHLRPEIPSGSRRDGLASATTVTGNEED